MTDHPDKPEPAPEPPPVPATAGPAFDRAAELFLALTTRWRTPRGPLAVGVPYSQLVEAVGGAAELQAALDTLRSRIAGLGLELVEYRFAGEPWSCLRSVHVAPTELGEDQQGVLGVVIMLIEAEAAAESAVPDTPTTTTRRRRRTRAIDGEQPAVPTSRVVDLLAGGGAGGYLSRSRLDDILKGLEESGYLIRRSRRLQYGPRTMIEFPDDAREAIAEQANRLIS